jgi:hypothetical protein
LWTRNSKSNTNNGEFVVFKLLAMLAVHHLQRAQSKRVVWLCEEVALNYELKTYQGRLKTFMAPPELQAL